MTDAVTWLALVTALVGAAVVAALVGCMRALYAIAAEVRALQPPPMRAADSRCPVCGTQHAPWALCPP